MKTIASRRTLPLCLTLFTSIIVSNSNVTSAQVDEDGEQILEQITVTGSRISRPEFSQPAPVVTISQEEMTRFATPDVGSMLAELPAIGATRTLAGNTSGDNGGNELAGTSSADLRRFGEERTLVLVDGKRHVAGVAGSSQVDLTTIPAALVERIDIVTGGTSAVYGSDAVTGVVNVILRDDFEGFELNVSGAGSTEGVSNDNYSASLVGGFNFSEDRGNITVYGGYDKIEETLATDIRQFSSFGTIANPADGGEDDGIPDRLVVPNVVSERINSTGVINPFAGAGDIITFDNAGNPITQQARDGTNSFAFGSFPNGCDFCFSTEGSENYLPEVERKIFGTSLNYEINENMTAYGSFKYVESEVLQLFQPAFRFGDIVINVAENPFLDNGLRQTLLSTGQTAVPYAKFFDELGFRLADNDRELFRYTAGLEGRFGLGNTDVSYDVYYVDGESENIRTTPNDLIPSNFDAAVDSVINPLTGQPDCRANVPSAQGEGYSNPALVNPGGCVPYNPFGFQQASQEARSYVSGSATRTDKITQEVYGVSFVTDTREFFNLPGGPVDFVLGYEHREESSSTISDEVIKSGVLTTAATPDNFGRFDVDEFFVEVKLPLLADKPFAEELTIDAAFRAADYSHAGDADAWKIGFLYAPVESLRLRGTIGEAVRAPSISEAFDSVSPGFAQINDPCDADNINDDPDRVANCAALGIPAGFQANDNVSIDILSGGNSELFSESSESYTVGFIWQPNFAENLNLTFDYYDIEITDAIVSVTAQNILDNCVDGSGGLDAGFCSQIDRDPNTRDVSLVRSGFLNASAFNTSGIELAIDYRGLAIGPGELDLYLFVNQLLELERFEFQNRPDEINVEDGEVGDPEFQYRASATYHVNDLSINWSARFIDRSANFDVSPTGDTPEDQFPAFIASITTHDLSANYAVNDSVSVYGGVRNVFDDVPVGLIKNALYDLVGRRVFFGIKAKF
ncbi:TonB-dependent receptor plug domain-containing protein [Arenicella xantha]|uniref:TonB-dependent receptor-like protein n=1 Tax=Arenicella xantha TaxID=644221 RepID=A0A395JRC6_9GAMM|nr:TonB-dependent receptor [Arenicella xantha]RBP53115.1 TonB-dependent receptor-like protein [Arenicella xantha]